jgi:hypothetical protein
MPSHCSSDYLWRNNIGDSLGCDQSDGHQSSWRASGRKCFLACLEGLTHLPDYNPVLRRGYCGTFGYSVHKWWCCEWITMFMKQAQEDRRLYLERIFPQTTPSLGPSPTLSDQLPYRWLPWPRSVFMRPRRCH